MKTDVSTELWRGRGESHSSIAHAIKKRDLPPKRQANPTYIIFVVRTRRGESFQGGAPPTMKTDVSTELWRGRGESHSSLFDIPQKNKLYIYRFSLPAHLQLKGIPMPHELTLSGLLQPPSVCATLYHVSKLASKNHPDSRYMRGTFRVFNATEFEIETGEWEVGAYPVSTMYRFEPIIIIPQTGVGEVFTPEKLEEENFNRPLWEKVAVFILECLIELTATHRELIENDMRIEEAGTDAEQALLPKKT